MFLNLKNRNENHLKITPAKLAEWSKQQESSINPQSPQLTLNPSQEFVESGSTASNLSLENNQEIFENNDESISTPTFMSDSQCNANRSSCEKFDTRSESERTTEIIQPNHNLATIEQTGNDINLRQVQKESNVGATKYHQLEKYEANFEFLFDSNNFQDSKMDQEQFEKRLVNFKEPIDFEKDGPIFEDVIFDEDFQMFEDVNIIRDNNINQRFQDSINEGPQNTYVNQFEEFDTQSRAYDKENAIVSDPDSLRVKTGMEQANAKDTLNKQQEPNYTKRDYIPEESEFINRPDKSMVTAHSLIIIRKDKIPRSNKSCLPVIPFQNTASNESSFDSSVICADIDGIMDNINDSLERMQQGKLLDTQDLDQLEYLLEEFDDEISEMRVNLCDIRKDFSQIICLESIEEIDYWKMQFSDRN